MGANCLNYNNKAKINIFDDMKRMEFNVLPKSKFLSLSPRNNHRSCQTTSQTINVILPREPKPSKPAREAQTPERGLPDAPAQHEDNEHSDSQAEIIEPPKQIEVPREATESIHYATREVKLDEPAEQLSKEDTISTVNFLKLVLQSYMNNPIKYNGFVICSVPTLENLIETLTGCDDCSIDIGDIEAKCCGVGKTRIIPITKIWVRNGDVSEVFKYKYSPYLSVFEEYRISLKFVYVE